MTIQEARNKLAELGEITQVMDKGENKPISRIIVAATDPKVFADYIKYVYQNQSYEYAALRTGAKDFDLLVIFTEPNRGILVHGWLYRYLKY